MSMNAASKPASPMISTICGSAIPPTWVPNARPPWFRIRNTRFSFMTSSLAARCPRLGRTRGPGAQQAGDDHVAVHDVAKDVVKRGQRRVVLLLAICRIAVADHNLAAILH